MEILDTYAEQPLTKQVILSLLGKYKRPYDKISELLKKGELAVVKRGVYIPGPNSKAKQTEKFLLANHLSGPSYISLESAMSYWGMIPERVYETTSVSLEKTILFKTPVGRFRYIKIPLPYYALGIQSIALTTSQHALIATPEKAVCDKIVTSHGLLLRSIQQTKSLLLENWRMDPALLNQLDIEKIESWIKDAPKATSLNILVKTLQTL